MERLLSVAVWIVAAIIFGALVAIVRTFNPVVARRLRTLRLRGALGLLFLAACEVFFLVQVIRGPEMADRLSNAVLFVIIGGFGVVSLSMLDRAGKP